MFIISRRTELQTLLETTLGSRNVYFQPPETIKMNYPCIIYYRSAYDSNYANDNPYNKQAQYTILVVDKNPDSLILDKILKLRMCRSERHYTKDNLNYDVFNIYY